MTTTPKPREFWICKSCCTVHVRDPEASEELCEEGPDCKGFDHVIEYSANQDLADENSVLRNLIIETKEIANLEVPLISRQDLCDEIDRLANQSTERDEQIEKLVAALEFYSPSEKWQEFISDGEIFDEQEGDFGEAFNNENGTDSGSTARQALADLEEWRKK